MDRVYTSGASATPPTPPVAPSAGYPQAANPSLGLPATKPGPWWYHMITESLLQVVVDGGETPDHTDPTLLSQAITAMIAAATPQTASIQGAFKNLEASATGTNATVTVSVDEIAVESATNSYETLRGVALAINAAAAGENGLDTGVLAGSTWYAVWIIYNQTTQAVAGLLSLSATAPTLPAGYTHKARVGWIRTDGTANKYPLSFTQEGRRVQYRPAAASNLTAFPQMASGVAASLTAVAWGSFAPPTAGRIAVSVFMGLNAFGGAASNNAVASSQTAFALPIFANGAGSSSSNYAQANGDLALESANIYWSASSPSGGTSVLGCIGWEDNL